MGTVIFTISSSIATVRDWILSTSNTFNSMQEIVIIAVCRSIAAPNIIANCSGRCTNIASPSLNVGSCCTFFPKLCLKSYEWMRLIWAFPSLVCHLQSWIILNIAFDSAFCGTFTLKGSFQLLRGSDRHTRRWVVEHTGLYPPEAWKPVDPILQRVSGCIDRHDRSYKDGRNGCQLLQPQRKT